MTKLENRSNSYYAFCNKIMSKEMSNQWRKEIKQMRDVEQSNEREHLLHEVEAGMLKTSKSGTRTPVSPKKLALTSTYGLLAVCFGTALYGSLGTIIQLSKASIKDGDEPYDNNAALLVGELCKLLFTIVVFFSSEGPQNAIQSIRAVPIKEWLLFSVPAILYSITNNLSIVQLKYMDPGTNAVLCQSKIITTALLWWFWFKKSIDKQQWFSLCLLMAGSMIVAFPSTKDGASTMYVEWPIGPFLVLVMIVLSALAGICTESVYKTYGRGRSIHIDNISMYIWGIASNAFQFYWIGGNNFGTPLLTGFNGWTWMMVATSVSLGLIIGFVMKYFDNIIKLLMAGASIIVSGVLSYLVFGYKWTLPYACGSVVVVCAVLLYKSQTKYIR